MLRADVRYRYELASRITSLHTSGLNLAADQGDKDARKGLLDNLAEAIKTPSRMMPRSKSKATCAECLRQH